MHTSKTHTKKKQNHTHSPISPKHPQRKSDKGAQAAVIELYVRKIYKMHKIKSVDAFTCLAGNGKLAWF
jgi:hypothetical protein